MNRIEWVSKQVTKDPVYNMRLLLDSLSPAVIVPDADKYYVFVYKAKTKNIRYDQHPFIVCSSVHKWGFTGYNFHWNDYRRYSWLEVISNLYEINEEELNTMENYPITKFRMN